MKKIVGIRLKPGGKIYDFDCGAFVLNEEDKVIVETDQGLAIGVVAVPPVRRNAESLNKPLKKIYRLANQKDLC
ncbi:MAG: stage 0 sporulation protein, partial [Desulfobacterales bacterium]